MTGLRVTERVEIPEAELSWRFSRSAGPGGQSVNTTDSRVELSFDVANSPTLPAYLRRRALERLESRLADGVLTIAAREHRSQLKNRRTAERRMATLLAEAFAPPPPPRRPTAPTLASQKRRVESKQRRSQIKRLRRNPED